MCTHLAYIFDTYSTTPYALTFNCPIMRNSCMKLNLPNGRENYSLWFERFYLFGCYWNINFLWWWNDSFYRSGRILETHPKSILTTTHKMMKKNDFINQINRANVPLWACISTEASTRSLLNSNVVVVFLIGDITN